MLWDIRARMKPALSVIDMIPNVHRTAALAALRRAVFDGRPLALRLSSDDKELAFYDAPVQLTSPIGAKVLKALYFGGHLKLKKPAGKALPALDAYIETEAAFRAEVAEILAKAEAKRQRLAEIIADPATAAPEEVSRELIDKVITAHLGRAAVGEMRIGGLMCHRSLILPETDPEARMRAEPQLICWWLDAQGQRQGDPG